MSDLPHICFESSTINDKFLTRPIDCAPRKYKGIKTTEIIPNTQEEKLNLYKINELTQNEEYNMIEIWNTRDANQGVTERITFSFQLDGIIYSLVANEEFNSKNHSIIKKSFNENYNHNGNNKMRFYIPKEASISTFEVTRTHDGDVYTRDLTRSYEQKPTTYIDFKCKKMKECKATKFEKK